MRRAAALTLTLTAGVVGVAAPPEVEALHQRAMAVPVSGVARGALRDTYSQGRSGHSHEAIDIAAPTGTPVLAVADGRLAKLFTSVAGGLTLYQLDAQGQFFYYYAHLARYADGVHEGMLLHRCELIGYVGTTGNASPDSPHLHFAVFVADTQKRWWLGAPINPFPALKDSASPGC